MTRKWVMRQSEPELLNAMRMNAEKRDGAGGSGPESGVFD